jgi:hypothetical protein
MLPISWEIDITKDKNQKYILEILFFYFKFRPKNFDQLDYYYFTKFNV